MKISFLRFVVKHCPILCQNFHQNYKELQSIGVPYFTLKLSTSVREAPVWGQKKSQRKVKLNLLQFGQMDAKNEEILAPLRQSVKEQVSLMENDAIFLFMF